MRPALQAAVLTLALAASGGCNRHVVKHPPSPQEQARHAYFKGMEDLVAGNYLPAIQIFNQVARSPRYVRYAALARLRIGDAFFLQDRFEEAIEAYRVFVAQYGSDANVPYARFRIAAAYHARMPGSWFATPPASEMDQTMTTQAQRELEGFLRTFPTSRYAPEARRMLIDARKMLLEHELYVARYYEKRQKWRATAWRLDGALRTYPELAGTPDIVWRMARAYQRADEDADAARAYAMYLERFPKGPKRRGAKQALDELRRDLENPPPAAPESGADTSAPHAAPAPAEDDDGDSPPPERPDADIDDP
ncbi:MAG: outer membrane protein assembly factor BamD [Deltaproteobacteria bacterium]|nr:outer membrane protein assembly factor BamD [Deltaproteobacteria bacterium]MCB9788048.1 outer membrane protein assembly factor BamD [Deltaproteobacteria bacterium]